MDDLLAEKRGSLKRLLDLYLARDSDQCTLKDHNSRLFAEIAGLERERATLRSRLEAGTLSDQQIAGLKAFAEQVTKKLVHN